MTAPSLRHTGLGYEYFRCRAGNDDSTVYVHQLLAILDGEDPQVVFSPDVDVHHENHIPWGNWTDNIELEESRDHRVSHLDGRSPVSETETGDKPTHAEAVRAGP